MAFIADLLAIRKAGGFASHSAKIFCTFCDCLRSELEGLDPHQWRPRNGLEVRNAAWEWYRAQTKKAREALFATTGVRWSSLQKLFYRDPVRHTVLGVMHNWMEGILQHHARRKWGIGIEPSSSKGEEDVSLPHAQAGTDGAEPHFMEIDMSDLPAEVEELMEDSARHNDAPSFQRRHTATPDFRMDSSGEESGDDEFLQPDEESDSDDSDDDSSNTAPSKIPPCLFNTADLGEIREAIRDTILPSWVDRPPTNLGDKSHGKLKADNWFILFSVMLPMALVELWTATGRDHDSLLLQNFYDLVTCTNIVGSYTTSNTMADTFLMHYIRYRTSLQQLFPGSSSVPNHHYAMHYPELLKFWGPLMKISEFAYEHHNGMLQKIKTNGHMHDLDYTMLQQICRRSRLSAKIQDAAHACNPLAKVYALMTPHIGSPLLPAGMQGDYLELMKAHARGDKLDPQLYQLMLEHLNNWGFSARHYQQLPHPMDAVVLSPTGLQQRHFKYMNRDFSDHTAHEGNSSILYQLPTGERGAGFIHAIWSVIVGHDAHLLLVVTPHEKLSDEDQGRNPFVGLPGLLIQLGENAEDFDVSNETPSALQKSRAEAKPEDTQDPSNPPESSDNVSIPPPASRMCMKHPTPAPVQRPQHDHQSSQYARDLMSGEEHTSVKPNNLSIPAGLQIPRQSFTIKEVPDEGDEAGGIENALVAKTGEAEALNPRNLGDVRKHPD
ncbi:hypothetical protein OE88DRAFT_1736117 [Heliocybe sulcata]|uniref:Uncharacterized protein n=1 Tax=Heliocybe sulcata TaxID=5364 RepID=A0A5C3N0P3_9AGAM|nr:hypothetical protein OE88DRAFT_1736117 [Heliocybe sulcata]